VRSKSSLSYKFLTVEEAAGIAEMLDSSPARAYLLKEAGQCPCLDAPDDAPTQEQEKVTADPAEDTRDGEDGETCKCSECGYSAPHSGGTPCVEKYCPKCGGKMMNGKATPLQEDDQEDEVVESGQRKATVADAIKKVGEYAAKVFGFNVVSKDRQHEEIERVLEIVRSFNGDEPVFFTVKSGADYRWVAISSSMYQDRDGEIVPQMALERDVADNPQDRGALLFWHEKGIELGTCDFACVLDGFLVESGVWSNSKLGVAARKATEQRADYYGLSIGFMAYVPAIEEDKDVSGTRVRSIYNRIRVTERSILPEQFASNMYTAIQTKGITMDPKKVTELEVLVGRDLASAVIAQVSAKKAEADSSGTVSKEVKPTAMDVIVKALEEAGMTAEAEAIKAAKPPFPPKDEEMPEDEEDTKKPAMAKKETSAVDDVLKQLLAQMVDQQKSVLSRMDAIEAADKTRAGLVRPSTSSDTVTKDTVVAPQPSGGDVILDSMSQAILSKVLGGGA